MVLQSSVMSLLLSTQMSRLEFTMIFAGLGPDQIFNSKKNLSFKYDCSNALSLMTFEKPDGRGKGGQLVSHPPPPLTPYEFTKHPCRGEDILGLMHGYITTNMREGPLKLYKI